MTNGWLVETEHYVVKTNHSLSAGVKLGRRLEWLYDVWQQLYVSYYSSDEILRRRLREDAINTSPRRKYKLVVYRNRSEYVRDLKKYQPQLAKTLGIYLGRQRTAYFFANEDADDATLFHEATHQLFQENGPGRKNSSDDIGADDNFWILEGIALYMESLQLHGGYATLGGVDTDRLQFARHNLYCGGFYEPLGRLTELGREELQGHPQIGQIYSQSAGLTQFFMHARKGAYRSSLLQYLKRVYERRDRTETLAELTTLTYGELDQAYRTSLNVRDPDLAGLRSLGSTKRLLLGRTQLTDDGVQWLRDAHQLQDLNLDGTAITDESLEVIGRLTQLEELDISGTRISNHGLRYLQDLQRLRVLWLSRTLVTDPCIDHLQALQGLRELHVEDTELSPTTLQSLQQLLPSVKVIQ